MHIHSSILAAVQNCNLFNDMFLLSFFATQRWGWVRQHQLFESSKDKQVKKCVLFIMLLGIHKQSIFLGKAYFEILNRFLLNVTPSQWCWSPASSCEIQPYYFSGLCVALVCWHQLQFFRCQINLPRTHFCELRLEVLMRDDNKGLFV